MKPRVLSPVPTAAPASPPLLISYMEAARQLGGVSTRHVERLVAAGKLRAVGRGKARRVLYTSLVTYVETEAANG